MMAEDPKRVVLESNIKLIQNRIQQLETSYHNLQVELVYDQPDEEDMPEPVQVFDLPSPQDRTPPTRSRYTSAHKRTSLANRGRAAASQKHIDFNFHHNNNNNSNNSPVKDSQTKEALMRQIDASKENERQLEVKVEALTFRCDKLQGELSLKADLVNRLSLEVEERAALFNNSAVQVRFLEQQVEQHKRTVLPELQKLKCQYDVSLLELRTLEHDNGILEARVRALSQNCTELKNHNRELKQQNGRIEMERLTLRKEIEALRAQFLDNESDLEELSDKCAAVCVENERLRNELASSGQKLAIFTADRNGSRSLLERVELERVRVAPAKLTHSKVLDASVTLVRSSKKTAAESISLQRSRVGTITRTREKVGKLFASEEKVSRTLGSEDRLDFADLAGIEERFKKLIQ